MDGIRLWNNLPDDVKDLDSFDYCCDKVKPLAKRNELYNGFTREANIAHAQLRMQCSNLNGHLYNLYVIDSPKCSCSHDIFRNLLGIKRGDSISAAFVNARMDNFNMLRRKSVYNFHNLGYLRAQMLL